MTTLDPRLVGRISGRLSGRQPEATNLEAREAVLIENDGETLLKAGKSVFRCFAFGAAMAVNHLTPGEADKQRNEPLCHRRTRLSQYLVRHPARWDEQRRKQAPGNKGADIRHYHCAEETAEFLHSFFCFHFYPSINC